MSVNQRSLRMLAPAMLSVLLLLGAQRASANCRINPAVNFVTQDIDVNLGEISVPSSLPVGGVILTRSFPVTAKAANTFLCDLAIPNQSRLAFFASWSPIAVPGMTSVYSTAVAGVGIRIRQTVAVQGGGVSTLYYYSDVYYGPFQSFGIPSSNVVVELIKTSASVGSGPLGPSGIFAGQQLYYADKFMLTLSVREGGALIKSPTCKPSAGSRNIAVNFGSVSASAFSGVGTVAANRDFTIELDCQSSIAAGSTVGVRVDAQQDASNLPGVLPLTASADAASGIAIQMVRHDGLGEQSLRFGENIVLVAGAMNAGTLVLPLRARYIQTKAGQIGPGSAGGVATFVIQYN
ncbi:MAG: fimbrial protein [Stenotrophomonas sp.]|jgi:type 1 fimbria pilin|nr:MAG: fimbrial protein [Stenotrophomonas sp.]